MLSCRANNSSGNSTCLRIAGPVMIVRTAGLQQYRIDMEKLTTTREAVPRLYSTKKQ